MGGSRCSNKKRGGTSIPLAGGEVFNDLSTVGGEESVLISGETYFKLRYQEEE